MSDDSETVLTAAAEAASIFGKVDCAAFEFASDDDAAVYAEVEAMFEGFESAPSVEALTELENTLATLAGYPLVTAVLSGRYPRLFSCLKQQQRQLAARAMTPAQVADVDWELWCRNTWLTNACAVDDLGEVAQATVPALAALLRRLEKDNDNHVHEAWSVLHIIASALRCSAVAQDLLGPLAECSVLWDTMEAELVHGGRHTSIQLVLLDLLQALALHASASAELTGRLRSVAGGRAEYSHPVHLHTALALHYACVLCSDDAVSRTEQTGERLRSAWASMTAQADGSAVPLTATEWVIGASSAAHLAVAARLREQLVAAGDTALDAGAVRAFRETAEVLPVEERAFCLFALPGNALLRLHATLASAPSAEVVEEVVATLERLLLTADVAETSAPSHAGSSGAECPESAVDGYLQRCVQQLWMNGLSATLHALLQRCDPAITAAVVRLLHGLAAHTAQGSAARRVLIGSPSLSLVGDVVAGVAEAEGVRAELQKATVAGVVEAAMGVVCAMERAELSSVFTDALVFAVSTLVSEGKDQGPLLHCGLCGLAKLAAAFPMAGSMVLDFEFLMQQCTIADAPAGASAALVVGSLGVMSAVVTQQPAAVTFEWIELLLSLMQNLAGWRDGVEELDVALWECVRHTAEASEDSNDYLFTEEAQEVLRNELERVKHQDARYADIFPSLLGIAVCMQAEEHAEVYTAVQEVLARLPSTAWSADICEGALRFLAAASAAQRVDAEDEDEEREECGTAEPLSGEALADLILCVLSGARQSGVALSAAALEDFARAAEERGSAAELSAAVFRVATTTLAESTDAAAGEAQEERDAQLCHAALRLLHCLLEHCPATRTEATAAQATQLLATVSAQVERSATPSRPDVVEAVLLLVNDACAASAAPATAGDEKCALALQELWRSLQRVTEHAAGQDGVARWQRVLSRVYGAAHALLLSSSRVPFGADGDPRLDYVGTCGLSHVAVEPCNAMVQTVLNYDEARAYLRRHYAAPYLESLAYMADPAHNVSGVVPLSLQRYVDEAKEL